jgi:hypothetical protein
MVISLVEAGTETGAATADHRRVKTVEELQ